MTFPSTIHQIWFDFNKGMHIGDELNEIIDANKITIRESGIYEYKLWNLSSANEFIETYYPFYMSFMKKKWKFEIIKCDFFRYLLMYHYGGLYIDLDFILLKSFGDMWLNYKNYDIVLFEEWYKSANIGGNNGSSDDGNGSLHNGFLLSKAKNKFWLKMINKLVIRANTITTTDLVWKLSGTNLLRNMYIIHESDSLIIYQPYYKVCPFKSVSKEDGGVELLCTNKMSVPLSLQESHWRFFTLEDIHKKIKAFDESYAICVGVSSGSLWR